MPVSPASKTAICNWINAFFKVLFSPADGIRLGFLLSWADGGRPVFLLSWADGGRLVFLLRFRYGFLGKTTHRHNVILYPVAVILEQ